MSTKSHQLLQLLKKAFDNDDAIEASILSKKIYMEIQATGVDYE